MLRNARSLLLALALTSALPAPAAPAEALQVLDGRIVRSLAVHPVDPARILVGTKGSEPGSGFVLESRDSGVSWQTLNDGQPLGPEVSDVQALAFGPGGVIFAGTWKQGLFVSRDGRRFAADARLPSKDVRDFVLLRGDTTRLLAATGNAGVLGTDDGAASWHPLGLDKTYVWSLSLSRPSEAALYAASPSRGVFGSVDGGRSWYTLFDGDGAYAVDASDFGADSFIVAGETGLHFSPNGKDWLRFPGLGQGPEGEKLSAVLGVAGHPILVGSWSDGVMTIDEEGGIGERLLPGTPVVHLARAGTDLLVGTWGQGLYIFPDWFR